MIPHTCPVCHGATIVSRPDWIAGDVLSWVSNNTQTYPCKACSGTGIVWEKEEENETLQR